MTQYYPKIKLYVGDMVYFDGEVVKIVERASSDSFLVESPGKKDPEEWHVDHFSDQASWSEHVEIRSKEPSKLF